MTTTLAPALSALGYASAQQQRAMVKLLAFSGAYGELPRSSSAQVGEADSASKSAVAHQIISDKQADAVLNQVHFENADAALEWLHTATQAHFLRAEKERHNVQDSAPINAHRAEMLSLLNDIGASGEAAPKRMHYDMLILPGSMEADVETRLNYMRELWETGVRWDRMILLGAKRPLVEEHELSALMLPEKTETQMMLNRLRDHAEFWPTDLQDVPKLLVDTPLRDGGARPNTRDTVEYWMQADPEKPRGGTALVVSSQPYARYQQAAIASSLPEGFDVEAVGAAANPEFMRVSLALDAVARQIDVSLARTRAKMQLDGARTEHLEQLVMVDPTRIKQDPARFQFRKFSNDSGVEKAKRHEGPYDPLSHADPLLLWQDKSGQQFVVDGHHRTEFFKRLRAEGHGPASVPARVLYEADGYTPEDAKIVGAYVNFMKDHTPDITEAAKVFHEVAHGKVHTELLPTMPLNEDLQLAKQAGALSAPAFAKVMSGEVPVEMAADVATQVKNPTAQVRVMDLIAGKLAAEQQLAF